MQNIFQSFSLMFFLILESSRPSEEGSKIRTQETHKRKVNELQLVTLDLDMLMSDRVMASVLGLKKDTVYCIDRVDETSLGKLYVLYGTYKNPDGEYLKSSSRFANVPEHYVIEFKQLD